jgi:hypothetical protein
MAMPTPLIEDPLATPSYVAGLALPLRVLWSDVRGPGLGPSDIAYNCDLRQYGPRAGMLKMIEDNPLAAHLGAADLLPGALKRAWPQLHRRIASAHEDGVTLYDGQKVICTAAYELGPHRLALDLARASYLGRLIVINDPEGLDSLRAASVGVPSTMALPVLGIATCLFTGDRRLILTRRSRAVATASGARSISASGGVSATGFGGNVPYLHLTAVKELGQEIWSTLGERVSLDDVRVRAIFVNTDNLQVGAIAEVVTRLGSAEIMAGRGEDAYEVDEREAVRADENLPGLIDRLVSERVDWEPMSLFGALLCLGSRHSPEQVEELVERALVAHPYEPQS